MNIIGLNDSVTINTVCGTVQIRERGKHLVEIWVRGQKALSITDTLDLICHTEDGRGMNAVSGGFEAFARLKQIVSDLGSGESKPPA